MLKLQEGVTEYDAYESAEDVGHDSPHNYKWSKSEKLEGGTTCHGCSGEFAPRSFAVQPLVAIGGVPLCWFHVRCFDFRTVYGGRADIRILAQRGRFARKPRTPAPSIGSARWVKELVKALETPSFRFLPTDSFLCQLVTDE